MADKFESKYTAHATATGGRSGQARASLTNVRAEVTGFSRRLGRFPRSETSEKEKAASR